jgi:ABC-type Na+ transport system ATPase subunit NatA
VHVEGRLAALIELGAGFHPEFTGRENINISGMLLGLSRREVLQRVDDIMAFADIGDFIEQPARTYSSGMFMRLGFAVAVHLDPDVLLIDEALAVGDEAFAKKCGDRLADFRRRGKTIVLVSHDLSAVKRWCDEAVWLSGGVVRAVGSPSTVIEAYHGALAQKEAASALPHEVERLSPFPVAIVGLRLSGEDGMPRDMYRAGEILKAALTYRGAARARPQLGFEIVRADGLCVYGAWLGAAEPGTLGEIEIEITIDRLDLVGGAYFFDITARGSAGRPSDRHQRRYPFRVHPDPDVMGVAHLRHRWRVVEAVER